MLSEDVNQAMALSTDDNQITSVAVGMIPINVMDMTVLRSHERSFAQLAMSICLQPGPNSRWSMFADMGQMISSLLFRWILRLQSCSLFSGFPIHFFAVELAHRCRRWFDWQIANATFTFSDISPTSLQNALSKPGFADFAPEGSACFNTRMTTGTRGSWVWNRFVLEALRQTRNRHCGTFDAASFFLCQSITQLFAFSFVSQRYYPHSGLMGTSYHKLQEIAV